MLEIIGPSLIIFGELEFLTRRYCKHGKFKIVQIYQYHISKLVRGERKQLHKDRGGIRGEGIIEIHDEKLWESWDEKKKQTILWAPEPHLSQLFQTLSFWLYELVKNLVKKKEIHTR